MLTGFAFVIYFHDSDFSDPSSDNNKKLGEKVILYSLNFLHCN